MPLSYSQLSLYTTCPKRYEFACIKKIPRQISAGESFGSSVHNALARFGALEVERGKRKEERDQLTMFVEETAANPHPTPDAQTLTHLWHQSFIIQGYKSKADADKERKRCEIIMKKYFDWWSKQEREVIAIESGFTLEMNNETMNNEQCSAVISGRFDRVEKCTGGLCVIDYKTSASRSQQEVDEDLQLSLYAIAAEQEFALPCTELLLVFLREDGVQAVRTTRSQHQKAAALSRILEIGSKIEHADFTATPSDNVCLRCPYRGVCEDAALYNRKTEKLKI